jgi:nicotinamidase-related amidase
MPWTPIDRSALVMWDIQQGIAPRAIGYEELRVTMAWLLGAARELGVAVIWSEHYSPPPQFLARAVRERLAGKQGVPEDRIQVPYPRGSAATKFASGFAPTADELVLPKTLPSLFAGTPAETLLSAAGVRSIAIAGVATEFGVELTARHATMLGFEAIVVSDAVGSFTREGHARGLESLRQHTRVVEAAELVDCWRKSM